MKASDHQEIRILLVTDSAEIGGGPRHLLLLMKYMDRGRFCPFVCYMKDGPMAPELGAVAERTARIGGGSAGRVAMIGELIRHIRRWKIDLVHFHGTRAGLVGCFATRWTGVPSVYTVHNLSVDRTDRPGLRWVYGLVEWIVCTSAEQVISVSEANRRAAIEQGIISPGKITTIRNGICLEEFQGVGRIREADDLVRVGVMGRLVPQKGHRYFIQAAYEVIKVRSDVRFVMIGEGPLEPVLKEMVRELGLDGYVTFAGATRDSLRTLSDLDIVVISSLWEGLPYVLLEALALGKPVIATRVNGIEEVVEDGVIGVLVPPGDSDALAQAVLGLMDDSERRARLGKAGAERVRREFDAAEGVRGMMEVYECVVRIGRLRKVPC